MDAPRTRQEAVIEMNRRWKKLLYKQDWGRILFILGVFIVGMVIGLAWGSTMKKASVVAEQIKAVNERFDQFEDTIADEIKDVAIMDGENLIVPIPMEVIENCYKNMGMEFTIRPETNY